MQSTFSLALSDGSDRYLPKPCVMGVINRSPNSFFRPFNDFSSALFAAEKMVSAGVSIIDVGGVATNPGVDLQTEMLSTQEEIDRVIPLIEALAQRFEVLLSVDTSCPHVMRAAIQHGAHIVNDQQSLQADGALACAAELRTPVCLMHSFTQRREPGTGTCENLLQQIKEDLRQRINACLQQGIAVEKIIIDPGFGGGNYYKSSAENFFLLAHLFEFVDLQFPVLVGWSRKSMVGEALGNVTTDKRLFGSIAAATIAALKGAAILRVHDVEETMDAVKIVQWLRFHS